MRYSSGVSGSLASDPVIRDGHVTLCARERRGGKPGVQRPCGEEVSCTIDFNVFYIYHNMNTGTGIVLIHFPYVSSCSRQTELSFSHGISARCNTAQ